jgi:serine/threonine protein kinase
MAKPNENNKQLKKEDGFKNWNFDPDSSDSSKDTRIGEAVADAFVSKNPYMAILDIATMGTFGGVGGKGMLKNFLMKSSRGKKLIEKLPFLGKLTEEVVSKKNKDFDFNKVRDFNKTVKKEVVAEGLVAKGLGEGNVHFKSVVDRTVPVRGGKAFDDAMGEYNSMKSMYNEFPKNVVKPLDPIFDKGGKLTGYNMEKIEGVDMMQWLDEGNKLTKSMYDDITSTITKMNKKGIYHGDLKINNIMIDKSGDWKLIDPVGFKHASNMGDDMVKVAKEHDTKALENLSKYVK